MVKIKKKNTTKVKKVEKAEKVKVVDKKKKKGKKSHKILAGIFYSLLLIGFLGVIAVCVAGTCFYLYIVSIAPEFKEDVLYRQEPSIIRDKDGKTVATIGTEDRELLTFDEIPEVLVNAIVATEDSRFFQHNGFDLPRFLVASIQQVLSHSGGGASTLTMQLSKHNYTTTEAEGWEGIVRKFTDIYMAIFKIEPAYSKQQILEFYVNSEFLGGGHGVEATAKNYFGKSAKDLNVAEAAMIAGLFQAPSYYNPYTNPDATEARRKQVLDLMLRHEYITKEEYDIAYEMTVEKIIQPQQSTNIGMGLVDPLYQQYIDMVISDVEEKTGTSPYTRPMIIDTPLDRSAQKHVSNIMNGKTYKWQNKKVQAGVAVVDINTGAITAVGGARNVTTARALNRAIDLNNQIGSTAKPLYDYGPAVEFLNWNTGTLLDDSKATYSDGTPISNHDNGYKGINTIEYHLKLSRNIPALRAFQSTSTSDKIKFVTSLGLNPEGVYYCDSGYTRDRNKCINNNDTTDIVDANIMTNYLHEPHAIGGYNGESPLSMAAAYAAFGNGGYYNEPYSFTKISYQDTGDVYINQTKTERVMQDSTAYIITKMLQATATYGIDSGSYRSINGIKYAAKTGTSNYDRKTIKEYKWPSNAVNDLWVVGYNTEYSIAVWYGYDNKKDGHNTLGSTQHQRLFQAVAKGIMKSKADFKMPDSVVKVTVESDSPVPLLPSKNTPSNYKKSYYFVAGSEPDASQTSTRFATLANVTDLKAENNGNGSATISWTAIPTPDPLSSTYLNNLFKDSTLGASSSKYANTVLKKNQSLFGKVGYNVYVEKSDGSLELRGWTENTNYVLNGATGSYKVVVKTCYQKFTTNMSSGVSTTANITNYGYTPPTPTDPSDQDETT